MDNKCIGICARDIDKDEWITIKIYGDEITSPDLIIDPELTPYDLKKLIAN